MILWNVRKEFREYRTEHPCQYVDGSRPFAYLHYSEPQCQHSGQSERCLEGCFRRVECRIDHFLEQSSVAGEQSEESKSECYDEKSYPNVVQNHDKTNVERRHHCRIILVQTCKSKKK